MTINPIFIEGFIVSIGLLMAIGPQNAYLLRQGLRRRHVGSVATVCFLADVFLISLGVLGVGKLIEANSALKFWLGWGGVAFLLWMAFTSVRSAMKNHAITAEDMERSAGGAAGQGVKVAVLHALAFSFLNPWVYIDTIVLVGGVSVKYGTDAGRLLFLVGAIAASGLWFFSLGYGAKKLAPMFENPRAWQFLDVFVAIIMLVVAGMLVDYQLNG
ncbi:MAG: LysE/ArgO family amino acid transporter [Kordiimonas sp.]